MLCCVQGGAACPIVVDALLVQLEVAPPHDVMHHDDVLHLGPGLGERHAVSATKAAPTMIHDVCSSSASSRATMYVSCAVYIQQGHRHTLLRMCRMSAP